MSRPPMKAIESIKNYCEKTQCIRCVFSKREERYGYRWKCKLQENIPCDWETDKGEE